VFFVSPVSPLPAHGFSVTLNSATPTDIAPGLFANTTEVQVYNPSDSDNLWLAFAPVVSLRAAVTLTVVDGSNLAPYVGDTVTLGASVLTAVGGPYVAGSNTFSVDIRSEGTIEVVNAPFPVGATITLILRKGPPDAGTVLTCVAGARVPGSLTFQSLAGLNAQAAEIAAAINDCSWSPASVRSASVVGPLITCIGGDSVLRRGANGNTSALAPGKPAGLGLATTAPTYVALGNFVGGVNADSARTLPDGSITANDATAYAENIMKAVNDTTNPVNAVFQGAQLVVGLIGVVQMWRAVAGTAGNGTVCTASEPSTITLTSPSAGGVDYPEALTAATAMVVGPGDRLVLNVGREGQRNPIQPASVSTAFPGANLGLVGQVSTGGADVAASLVYVNRGPE
jgi:hypothetical protein